MVAESPGRIPTLVVGLCLAVIIVISVAIGSIGGDFSQRVLSRLDIIRKLLGSFATMLSAIVPVTTALYGVYTVVMEGGANDKALMAGKRAIDETELLVSRFAELGCGVGSVVESPRVGSSSGGGGDTVDTEPGDVETPADSTAADDDDDPLPMLRQVANATLDRLKEVTTTLKDQKKIPYYFRSTIHRDDLTVAIGTINNLYSFYEATMKLKRAKEAKDRANEKEKKAIEKMEQVTNDVNDANDTWEKVSRPQALWARTTTYAQAKTEAETNLVKKVHAKEKAKAEAEKVEKLVEEANKAAKEAEGKLLSPDEIDKLRKLQLEIEELRHSQWYRRTPTKQKKLEEKKRELAMDLEKMPQHQRIDWLLHRHV